MRPCAVGHGVDRRLGTPKHVADEAGITVDWAQRDELRRGAEEEGGSSGAAG